MNDIMKRRAVLFISIGFMLYGCTNETDHSSSLGDVFQWLKAGFSLLYSGNWEFMSVGQAVVIGIIHLAILGVILEVFD
jgi:hypothetical protein